MSRVGARALKVGLLPLGLLGVASLASLAAALWPVDAGAPAGPPDTPPTDLGRLAAGDTGDAVSRPLFDPERRAWTARGTREDLTAEARPPTLLSVRGILIEDRVRRALVADGTGAPAWMVPGEGRGAWRLVSIEPTQVVVADSARHYTVSFLGPAVALRPPPRHPAPELANPELRNPEPPSLERPSPEPPNLRPALRPGEDAGPVARTGPATVSPTAKGAASVRRIEITRPAAP